MGGVSSPQQLELERRQAPLATLAAIGALALPILAVFLPAAVVEGSVVGARGLVVVAENSGVFLVARVIQAVGITCMAFVFYYLFRAIRQRRPEVPRVAMLLAIGGPLLFAAVLVATQVGLSGAAREFAASGPRTVERANELTRSGSLGVLRGIGATATLALAFATVLVSVFAMRVGLLSRFMGFIGIGLGVLLILPIGGGVLGIQTFWLGALAVLFADRWPGGRGQAWSSGEAQPWPSPGEVRARAKAAQEEADGRAAPAAGEGDLPDAEVAPRVGPGGARAAGDGDRAKDADAAPDAGAPVRPRRRKRRM